VIAGRILSPLAVWMNSIRRYAGDDRPSFIERSIALHLVDWMSAKNEYRVTARLDTIAERLGVSERTMQRHMPRLTAKCWLWADPRQSKTTVYVPSFPTHLLRGDIPSLPHGDRVPISHPGVTFCLRGGDSLTPEVVVEVIKEVVGAPIVAAATGGDSALSIDRPPSEAAPLAVVDGAARRSWIENIGVHYAHDTAAFHEELQRANLSCGAVADEELRLELQARAA